MSTGRTTLCAANIRIRVLYSQLLKQMNLTLWLFIKVLHTKLKYGVLVLYVAIQGKLECLMWAITEQLLCCIALFTIMFILLLIFPQGFIRVDGAPTILNYYGITILTIVEYIRPVNKGMYVALISLYLIKIMTNFIIH